MNPKFITLNLRPHLNADRTSAGWHPEVGTKLRTLPSGRRAYWGVPFDLGPSEGPCWILLDGAGSSLEVGLDEACAFLVFAHLCDVSHDPQGQAQPADYAAGEVTRPGERLADYVLVYADGSEHRQPIRRRFEVGEAVWVWGQSAFAARPHLEDEPRDWRGPYPATQWGKYQTGVSRSPTPGMLLYWVYALENPFTDKELVAVRLVPTGSGRMVVCLLYTSPSPRDRS